MYYMKYKLTATPTCITILYDIRRYLLGLTLVKSRHFLAQVKAYVGITTDDRQPMFVNWKDTNGLRLKEGKPWMAQAEDTVGQ